MKHAVMSAQVLVSMSKELPVVVKYQMGDIGHIRWAAVPLYLSAHTV